jgi:hypothetical protein
LDEDWSWRELEVALGIPPEQPKVAPWEAAYDDWLQTAPTQQGRVMTWIAAWEACEQHYNIETGGEA